jgi:hypothetical protein
MVFAPRQKLSAVVQTRRLLEPVCLREIGLSGDFMIMKGAANREKRE